ncbi:MAG: type I methionyl aminopeptidase [Candidatus Omnitrophica bacterium]|nr:type I methionyl aminopeptidase [Candidatus Omnitrophota bacterium]
MSPAGISIKTPAEIDIMRRAGKILAQMTAELKRSLTSGQTTAEVDRLAQKLMAQQGVKAAFKGYRGYPGYVCISINDEVVHGIPNEQRRIQTGDIVSLDMGIVYQGYYADMAFSRGIGAIAPGSQKLMDVTREALFKGIEKAKEHNRLFDISAAVQQWVESHGFSVVRDFVGHGIGKFLHEDPEIPNYGTAGSGPELKSGMVFCVEPMVNAGGWQTKILQDGWTVVTKDGKPSAHFEHMIVITPNGPEILTKL